MRSSYLPRNLPLEARLSIAVALVVALALSAIGLVVVARVHDRVAGEGRASLMRTLDAASPALEQGRVPRIPGTRLAWLDGGTSGGDAALVAAARAGHASDLGTVAEARVGTRRVIAVSRAPQHVERDLLLIEAEGLAPIGLVLVLVGVRLFERAGRRHRKQLETIVLAAQRIGDGDRSVALVPGRGEVGRVAGSLEHLANGLRELDRERGLYVSQVSHDLRNPLAVIGTYASVLRRGERSRPRAAKLQTIEDEVSRLALMVDDLLALGRTHALALHIQRAPTDVRVLVSDGVAAARARSGRTRVLLLASGVAVPAVVDAQRLRQALDNLLDNAVRHARSEVRVELVYESADVLVLRVEDDGPGIDRELLPRLFDAFAQGAGRVGGAGVGLSTVRAVAEAHGGGVTVGVARDRGARFTLRLPLAPTGTIAS
ncbi:MAG TPA: HAMP domain-containing sensor histidine kinase [Gaiellales bacterium]|nr:HAMP domain-containing sensor histidine kinase [Gaiellales bacterium]